jgi:hypothetical protein
VSVLERLRELPMITRLRERLPLLQRLEIVQVRALTPQQEELVKRFRRGLAGALGVPEEAIREEVLRKWVTEWTRAIVKEEYLREHPELLAMLGEAKAEIERSGSHY